MQKLILLIFSCGLLIFSFARKASTGPVPLKWMTLDQAASELKKEKKPVLIDLYTEWCGWCKVMDKKTYAKKNVSDYLQEKFYPVKFNAESRELIEWNGKQYHFNPSYRSNEFAIYLTGGRLEFPTTVIIPSNGDDPQAIPGYLEPKDLELIVKYFGEGGYGKIPFEEFQKNFKSSW